MGGSWRKGFGKNIAKPIHARSYPSDAICCKGAENCSTTSPLDVPANYRQIEKGRLSIRYFRIMHTGFSEWVENKKKKEEKTHFHMPKALKSFRVWVSQWAHTKKTRRKYMINVSSHYRKLLPARSRRREGFGIMETLSCHKCADRKQMQ